MKFDVDDIIREETALIINWPTGIIYSAQTGGIGCNHPECEGFLLSLPEFLQNFDDCSYGCSHLYEMPEARLQMAKDLDEFFKNNHLGHIQIDLEKLNELDEGWWPIIYNKELGDLSNGTYAPRFKGYIHTGNCD